MRKLFLILMLAAAVTACKQAPETAGEAGDVKSASVGAVTLNVDPAASTLRWEGAKITETVHYGKVSITEGQLSLNDGQLEAGSFVMDMTSITSEDLTDAENNGKLVGHLKSGDFFMVDSFPTAKFEITAVAPSTAQDGSTHNISGNLTIKGITKNISFPANVSVNETGLTASADIIINRNEWGVIWGGTKTDASIKKMLQDNLIKDEISFKVNLVANI